MGNKIPVIFSWSGGKDSAYALHKLMQDERYEIKYLLSTINGNNSRLSMHGVREELIEAQAASVGLPLLKVYVFEGNNEEYEKQMETVLLKVKNEGINTVAFGDILLEDLKKYREEKTALIGMNCIFPIWQANTTEFLHDFLKQGFKTITCCVNDKYLGKGWCGRIIDNTFINFLPVHIDPCGENGEYHSFCFDGPVFKCPINFNVGEIIFKPLEIKEVENAKKSGFWYCEILPA